MAVSKYGPKDWLAGQRIALTGGSGEGFVPASLNVDSTGVEVGTAGNPLVTSVASAGTIVTTQITVATTNTQIVAARAGRVAVIVTQVGTTDVFYGPTGSTITTGALLLGVKGSAVTLSTAAAIFGVVSTGTSVVTVTEVF